MSRERNMVRGDVKNPLYRVLKLEISSVDRFLVEAIVGLGDKYGVDDAILDAYRDIVKRKKALLAGDFFTYSLIGVLNLYVSNILGVEAFFFGGDKR